MDTIPNKAKVEYIEYIPDFSAICSVSNIPFHGKLLIEYEPDELLIEFESFEAWLSTETQATSFVIEDVARLVFDELRRVLGDIPVRVTVCARTTVHAPVSAQISNRWERT